MAVAMLNVKRANVVVRKTIYSEDKKVRLNFNETKQILGVFLENSFVDLKTKDIYTVFGDSDRVVRGVTTFFPRSKEEKEMIKKELLELEDWYESMNKEENVVSFEYCKLKNKKKRDYFR